jgi:hypothetical protein
MKRTIFTTPVVNTLLHWFSVGFLKLAGWRVEGQLPVDADMHTVKAFYAQFEGKNAGQFESTWGCAAGKLTLSS